MTFGVLIWNQKGLFDSILHLANNSNDQMMITALCTPSDIFLWRLQEVWYMRRLMKINILCSYLWGIARHLWDARISMPVNSVTLYTLSKCHD